MSTEVPEAADTGEPIKDGSSEAAPNPKEKKPPRSERKRRHYELVLSRRKENRKKKKEERKMRRDLEEEEIEADLNCSDNNSDKIESKKIKRQERNIRHKQAVADPSEKKSKNEIRQTLEAARRVGQRICVDCSLEEHMSHKEVGKLATQIGRMYGANRKADNPAHIYLTGLRKEGTLYQECIKKNDGFLNYVLDLEEKSHTELFPLDSVVYLSPDSDQALTDLDSDCVYIIGGLVDESVTKNISQSRADSAGIRTARLPIDEHMEKLEQPSYSKVLAVNQVFDILLTYLSTRSWRTALDAGVPKRKGYIVKPETLGSDT